MKKSTQINLAILALLFIVVPAASRCFAQSISSDWRVSEFQPNIPNGGRANTIAVHPTNANTIYVASETGGLFRSTDRGLSWRHVNKLPCFRMWSVAYLPSDPRRVLVTTADDFKSSGGGGIWRSTDGGLTWGQARVIVPGIGRLSGYDISVAPLPSRDIYVASEYGVLKSTDQGDSWSYQNVFGDGSKVLSVTALDNNNILAGGPSGMRRSPDGGANWVSPGTWMGGMIGDIHALGRSPFSRSQAFVVDSAVSLYYTEDAGQNWAQINSAPPLDSPCGGIAFARMPTLTSLARGFELYFGNRCDVSRLIVMPLSPGSYDYSGPWQTLTSDHRDTRDIAFLGPFVPGLLATDGGLHSTRDGGNTWTFTGGGRNGYNALQIQEVQGQLIEDINRFDLYFGTMDNDLWTSGDNGVTWPNKWGAEGYYIEGQKRVPTAADSKISFTACAPCATNISDPLFTNVTTWPPAPPGPFTSPVILKKSQHIQLVDDAGGFSAGIAVTDDFGINWEQYAVFPEVPRGLPKLGGFSTRRPPFIPFEEVYQAYRLPGWSSEDGSLEVNHLLRLRKSSRTPVADVIYPAMGNFGGLGTTPNMYQVYAIDPADFQHLIAPDVVNNKMMETRDGAENWTEIPGLTNLVTNGGLLRFSKGMFPVVSAISFCPQNPDFVIAGTMEGGLYVSTNNGANWFRVANSQGVTYVTGFAWKNAGDVVISTYGRGLWRLRSPLVIPRPDAQRSCPAPCQIEPLDGSLSASKVAWDRGILVYDGRIMGARVANGILKEVFVSNGSSVVFASEKTEVPAIKITETNKYVGFAGVKTASKVPSGAQLIKGLVFDKRNRLKGAIFGDNPMKMHQDKEIEDRGLKGNMKSPIEGKPYLRLTSKRFAGGPVAEPDEIMLITISHLQPNADVVIYVDDKHVARVRTDEHGYLKTEIHAPREFDMHSVTLRYANDEKHVIDGTMFFVRHKDDFKGDQNRK